MKLSEGKLKYSLKSVKGNKSREKENSRLFEHKAYLSAGIPLTFHSVLSFIKSVMRFLNTVTYWLMWLIGNLCETIWFRRPKSTSQHLHMRRCSTAVYVAFGLLRALFTSCCRVVRNK